MTLLTSEIFRKRPKLVTDGAFYFFKLVYMVWLFDELNGVAKSVNNGENGQMSQNIY